MTLDYLKAILDESLRDQERAIEEVKKLRDANQGVIDEMQIGIDTIKRKKAEL